MYRIMYVKMCCSTPQWHSKWTCTHPKTFASCLVAPEQLIRGTIVAASLMGGLTRGNRNKLGCLAVRHSQLDQVGQ